MDTGISQDGFPVLGENPEQLSLFSLQDMAIKSTKTVFEMKKQLKTVREMVSDALVSNSIYHDQHEKVKEVAKQLNVIKGQIESQDSIVALKAKMKTIRQEIKEKNMAVSDYTIEVIRQTGKTEFEKDGEMYEIKSVARLIKRRQ